VLSTSMMSKDLGVVFKLEDDPTAVTISSS
jgi:hypothetical protein